jgi:integrase
VSSARNGRSRERRRPFAAYYREWLATYARHHCKPGTVAGYEAAGRLYLIPAFGDRDVASITREDVKRLVYETLLPGRARATVRANLAPLRELFNHAIEDGVVATNPAAHVLKRMRGERVRAARAPRFLAAAELRALLEACRIREPRWYPFVLVLARTGMRLGEACALRWADVDLEAGVAVVRAAFWRGKLQAPKSGTGRRVDLSRQLIAVLRARRAEQVAAAREERRAPSPWLFASPEGRPPDTDAFRRGPWRRLFRATGLAYAWPHSLRHTYASLLISHGESLAYVKAQLGHRSIATTVDVYGHLVAGANRAAVDRLDDA